MRCDGNSWRANVWESVSLKFILKYMGHNHPEAAAISRTMAAAVSTLAVHFEVWRLATASILKVAALVCRTCTLHVNLKDKKVRKARREFSRLWENTFERLKWPRSYWIHSYNCCIELVLDSLLHKILALVKNSYSFMMKAASYTISCLITSSWLGTGVIH